jgi:hypothetical protein
MSRPTDPRPLLSVQNSQRLAAALVLSQELQKSNSEEDSRLVELRQLLDDCRDGVRRQNPAYRRQRLVALDQARNYLHFLPDLEHPQAGGRLRSVSRRLRRAMRT